MYTRIAQLVLSLLLIAGSLAIIFVFVFKSGHLTHRELWHTLLGLFLVLLLLLNIHPHWSVKKKHGQFFRDFVARAGADVRLMIPKKSDTAMMGPANKSFFKECLQSGVRIFEREGNFMHCKTFVTDDYLSSIGTANLDNRSFKLNYEDNAYLYDREIAAQNRDIFLRDLDSCTEVTLAEVESWPWYQVYPQKTLRLVSSVL